MLSNKRTILIAVFIVFLVGIESKLNPNMAFEEYCQKNECPPPGKEYAKRKQEFMKNYKQLLKIEKQSKDRVKPNFILTLDEEEKKKISGLKKRDPNAVSEKIQDMKGTLSSSPLTFDYRDYQAVTNVRFQSSCGSCWAFSSTGVYESALILYNGITKDLAEQFALECDQSSGGCNGGWPYFALQTLSNGVPEETSYPYQNNDYYFGSSMCSTSNKVKLNYTVTVHDYFDQYLTVEQIQNLLYTYGPLSVSVHSAHNSFRYSSGYVNSCPSVNNSVTDHVVLLVGYTTTHWIIKNSWGTSWGNNGYAYVDKVWDCGIKNLVNFLEVDGPRYSGNTPNPIECNQTITYQKSIQIQMGQAYGDQWDERFSFVQNGQIVKTFGEEILFDEHARTIVVTIPNGVETQLVVTEIGPWPEDVSFNLSIINGENIGPIFYSVSEGQVSNFIVNQILHTFTISQYVGSNIAIQSSQTEVFKAVMQDNAEDGWSGMQVSFIQGEITETIGGDFNNGKEKSVQLYFKPGSQVQIVVQEVGTYSEEDSFYVKDQSAHIVFSWASGAQLHKGQVLGTFCPGCGPNLQSSSNIQQQADPENQSQSQSSQFNTNKGLVVAVVILSVIVFVMGVIIVLQNQKNRKILRGSQSDGTDSAQNVVRTEYAN